MARTKQATGKGKPKPSKELRKKLTTKRDSLSKASTLRFSTGSRSSSLSSKDESARFSLPANLNRSRGSVSASTSQSSRATSLIKDGAYFARKSFIDSDEPTVRRSIIDSDVPTARKSMLPDSDESLDDTLTARKSIANNDNNAVKYPAIRKSIESGSKRVRQVLSSKPLRKSVNATSVPSTLQVSATKSLKKGKKVKHIFVAPHIDKRRKPGVLALQEIRYYQKRPDLLLRRLPFQRLVKEVLHFDLHKNQFRIQSNAILALQEATEMYLVDMFERLQLSAIHAKRVTILNRDVSLLKALDSL